MECDDCGITIPPARLKVSGSRLCVECQDALERLGLAPKYRMEVLGGRDIESFEDNGALVSKIAPRKAMGQIAD